MVSDTFSRFKSEVSTVLADALAKLGVDSPVVLDIAPDGMGDLAFPCFPLAKQMRKAPNVIAQELASSIMAGDLIEKVEAKGGYVNFHVGYDGLAQSVIEDALARKDRYGAGEPKKDKILLEHTSANPTGPLHVGRARNPIIGDTLARVMRMAGYDVSTEFYVNDVGRQVVVMTWGVKHLKLDDEPDRDADHYRYVLYYQKANKCAEEDPAILKQMDEMLYKLEHGDEETVAIARENCERVLQEIKKSMKRLNIEYDGITWESKFVQDGSVDRVIEALKRSEFSVEVDGAYHLELESFGISGRETKWVFTRSDGTSLYTTRDLAYHLDKFSRTDIPINVLGEDQKLGMQELAAALKIMGVDRKPDVVFYSFVSLPEGRMSTRKGRVVYIDDLIEEATERAYEEVKRRRPDISEEKMRGIARVVGVGSLRYNIIRIQAEKQIVFKWEDALNFEGASAPFVQYAHARACSIMNKAVELSGKFDARHLITDHEKALVKIISRFPSIIEDCADNRRAHPLAAYAQELAAQFNQFYRYIPVLKAEGEVREARLALVEASRWTIRNTLMCLGIDAPEEM
ncbi:MAG: arginine--tRNA ligase [Candidatus Thermoplasmatota archaeon]|nr:arginine--tRNA ligase [Candidatus Thermoplasmatota archaeon]